MKVKQLNFTDVHFPGLKHEKGFKCPKVIEIREYLSVHFPCYEMWKVLIFMVP